MEQQQQTTTSKYPIYPKTKLRLAIDTTIPQHVIDNVNKWRQQQFDKLMCDVELMAIEQIYNNGRYIYKLDDSFLFNCVDKTPQFCSYVNSLVEQGYRVRLKNKYFIVTI